MKLKILIILSILCHLSFALCHSALAVNGTTNDPSQLILGARQLGMGGVSFGFSSDAMGIFTNPAGLAKLDFPQLAASSRKIILDETQYSQAGWVVPTHFGSFGIGYIGMGTTGSPTAMRDPTTGRLILDPSAEASSYANSVLALNYSKEILPQQKLTVGWNLKFFNQALSGGSVSDKASASNFDVGISFKPLRWITFGTLLQNLLGGSMKWNSTEDKLSGYYKFGGAASLLGNEETALLKNSQALTGGFGIDLPANVLASSKNMLYHAGLEYYPAKNIALRAGLNQETAGSGFTLGLGLLNGGFRFDYAFAQRPGLPGDNPHYFTLSYVGEMLTTIFKTLKSKLVHFKLLAPRDRYITVGDFIAISAEAWATRISEQKSTWTVTGFSSTSEVKELTSIETLDKITVNEQPVEKSGTFEARQELVPGRNVIKLVGQTFPEMISPSKSIPANILSSEVRVLRFTPFSDVPAEYWATEPIALNVTLGLITGYPDNTFQPDKGITRAELVALLVRSKGIPLSALDAYTTAEIFSDVKQNYWGASFINFGSSVNYVSGYAKKTFKPNKILNRAEAITIMARYAEFPSEEAMVTPSFPDLMPGFWANQFIAAATKAGLLKYLEGKEFNPKADFTRAEATEVLYRIPAIQKKVEEFWERGTISVAQ